ncbi:hypothetical protein [Candidatus Spongiihabitans sp.]|uniref:hypothetical protein n=1 Tax=Candidatus Spongiihabitans sp. TaxID=3101308 RepID=UPI003C7C4FC9
MVNNCHAKRDTTGGYATLDSRLPARMTNKGCHCPANKGRHCPAHIIIGRAIQWNMPSGVAELICFDAAGLCLAKPDAKRSHATRDRYLTGFPPSARMTARRKCLLLTNVCARLGGYAASGFPPAGENDGREGGAKTPLERNKTGNELVNAYARIARRCVV